jgi:hypothetical protein
MRTVAQFRQISNGMLERNGSASIDELLFVNAVGFRKD